VRRNEIAFLIFALLMAAVVGGLLGDIIAEFLPAGAAKTVFEKNIQIGVGVDDPVSADFYSISFAFAFAFRINFVSVLFMIMVLIYFRWWYI
jgi:hypothetical protein